MKNLTILIVLIVVTVSCKKEKPTVSDPTPAIYPNYSQLKVGNYWVYERYEIDSNGNETPLGIIDTCRIEKDTIINGDIYYKYVRPPYLSGETASFIRDSLHYLVKDNGHIIFSSMVYDEVFRTFSHPQDYYELHEWMTDKDLIANTPYGSFTTSTFQQIFYMNEPFIDFGTPRYMNTRYADKVGIVTETLSLILSNSNYTERRLIDYHLE